MQPVTPYPPNAPEIVWLAIGVLAALVIAAGYLFIMMIRGEVQSASDDVLSEFESDARDYPRKV